MTLGVTCWALCMSVLFGLVTTDRIKVFARCVVVWTVLAGVFERCLLIKPSMFLAGDAGADTRTFATVAISAVVSFRPVNAS